MHLSGISLMRQLLWDSMLDADMSVRYWGYMARRFSKRELAIKVFLALTSSGAVAGWTLWAAYPGLWHFFSGVSAVTAIALPILDYSGKVATMVELRGKWSELSTLYDQMWARYGSNAAGPPPDQIAPLKLKEAELSKQSAVLPSDTKLMLKCQAEVRRARGLG
jgi:hypothetical protein